MTAQPLDLAVLEHDLPEHGLRRHDLGAVVDVYGAAIAVEFVAASGHTQALVTLRQDDVRAVVEGDIICVRSLANDQPG